MQIQLVKTENEFDALAADWKTLWKSSDASVFLAYDWMRLWWNAYHKAHPDATLFILAVYKGEMLKGIAPFFLTTRRWYGFSLRILSFLASKRESRVLDVLACKEDHVQVAKAIVDYMQDAPVDWLHGTCLQKGSLFLEALCVQAERKGFLLHRKEGIYTDIDLSAGFESYMETLASRMRTKVRKLLRRFDEETLSVRIVQEGKLLMDDFHSLVTLHQQRWEAQGEDGGFGGKKLYDLWFLESVLPVLALQGGVRLYTLLKDGQAVGHQLYFWGDGRLYLFQEGYDWYGGVPRPGNILRAWVMRQVAEEGKYLYDFMTGWTFHKKSWGGRRQTQWYVRIGKASLKNTFYLKALPLDQLMRGKWRGFIQRVKNVFYASDHHR